MKNYTMKAEESAWAVDRGSLGNPVFLKWHKWPVNAVSDLKI